MLWGAYWPVSRIVYVLIDGFDIVRVGRLFGFTRSGIETARDCWPLRALWAGQRDIGLIVAGVSCSGGPSGRLLRRFSAFISPL